MLSMQWCFVVCSTTQDDVSWLCSYLSRIAEHPHFCQYSKVLQRDILRAACVIRGDAGSRKIDYPDDNLSRRYVSTHWMNMQYHARQGRRTCEAKEQSKRWAGDNDTGVTATPAAFSITMYGVITSGSRIWSLTLSRYCCNLLQNSTVMRIILAGNIYLHKSALTSINSCSYCMSLMQPMCGFIPAPQKHLHIIRAQGRVTARVTVCMYAHIHTLMLLNLHMTSVYCCSLL